jgi:hypothetical protein
VTTALVALVSAWTPAIAPGMAAVQAKPTMAADGCSLSGGNSLHQEHNFASFYSAVLD